MMSALMCRLAPAAAAIAALGFAQDRKYKAIAVTTPDGVTISAQEWGNPAGPEILFIHGYSQASLSWARQYGSELASEFRIVTYDLRGHCSAGDGAGDLCISKPLTRL
jgi:non-heme chloroperoxidase